MHRFKNRVCEYSIRVESFLGHDKPTNIFSSIIPVNTKHLYNICTMLDQRRGCWAAAVQMLYTCFVFAVMFSREIHHPHRILVVNNNLFIIK